MVQIEQTLVSDDLGEKYFVCDLEKCKGACCVEGDAGAPLTAEEVALLPEIIEKIKPYLRVEGIKTIEERGTHMIDSEDETVTPLIQGRECAYVVFEDDIASCGIEKAFLAGAITFQKPVSCHLYPVRIRKSGQFIAVNYDIWTICEPARKKGEKEQIPVAEFTKEALIRRFGNRWYQKLHSAMKQDRQRDHTF